MCTFARARARSHGHEHTTAHMHNSGATNASSHVGERNIKKRAEHKATGRRRRRGYTQKSERKKEGERDRKRGTERARAGRRDEAEGASEIAEKAEERDAVGIKGEADKEKGRGAV